MKKLLQTSIIVICCAFANLMIAQTVILDFETANTTTTFQYFGSTLDGTLSETIPNPDPSGINISDNVLEFIKPANSQVWAGAFSNPDPQVAVDLISNDKICMKVWMPRPGGISLKLEGAVNGAPNWILTSQSSVANEWVEVCFDASLPSEEGPFEPAIGDVFTRLVIFTYFGSNSTVDETVYIDDIIALPSPTQTTVVLDFETENTTTTFQYFGSTLDGTLTSTIENPDKSGINTSDNVLEFVKPTGAQTWAGAFSNPDPSIPVDLTAGGEVCVKVWSAKVGNLAIKLEASPTGPDWILTQEITEINQWIELCFNSAIASIEGPFQPARGNLYQRIVLFFDFGSPVGGENQVYYLDDLVVKSAAGGSSPVTFTVNTSSLGSISDPVYLIGSFNDWSQSNPMESIGNGLYQTTLNLSNGIFEYKYMVGNAAIEENFSGLDECTVTSPDGEFTNRRVVVAGAATLPTVCFNSCYNCGEGVSITVNLGLGFLEPDPSGIYMAGGQAFGAPGGRFRLQDIGNNVFSITFERGVGFSSFYTFTNGACLDYSCKEDIAGQDCANPSNFNDRLIEPVMVNTVINTCFGLCTDEVCTIVSTNNPSFGSFFNVFPTLAKDHLIIQSKNSELSDFVYAISTLDGKLVKTQRVDLANENQEISIEGLAPGMFILSIISQGQQASFKFVKI